MIFSYSTHKYIDLINGFEVFIIDFFIFDKFRFYNQILITFSRLTKR